MAIGAEIPALRKLVGLPRSLSDRFPLRGEDDRIDVDSRCVTELGNARLRSDRVEERVAEIEQHPVERSHGHTV